MNHAAALSRPQALCDLRGSRWSQLCADRDRRQRRLACDDGLRNRDDRTARARYSLRFQTPPERRSLVGVRVVGHCCAAENRI